MLLRCVLLTVICASLQLPLVPHRKSELDSKFIWFPLGVDFENVPRSELASILALWRRGGHAGFGGGGQACVHSGLDTSTVPFNVH